MRNINLKPLTLLASILVSGFSLLPRSAFAANGWEISLNATTTTTSQTTSSVSLSLPSGAPQTNLDAANAATNPDEAGKVLSQTATITVGNTDGYTVCVSGNTALTGRNNTNHKIPSITSSKTLGSMSNEWGYYGVLGDSEASFNPNTNFKALSTSQQSVATGSATTSNITKKLTLFYGARVNSSITEDFYGNTVTLSVVAQPRTVASTVATFNGITTMQQMTPTICKNAKENDTAYLRDTRDNKYYWVTKLLDGNCWMSQNLALDLSTSKTLTSSDTDVSSFTPGHNTTSSVTTGNMTQTETYSWNLGNYIIINPTATTTCSQNSTGLSACSGQFMAVGSRTASTDPNFYKNNGATYTSTEYDAHYLAGNYYQWNAATAGTGGTITSANATGSICPKGWKLPNSNSTAKNSFDYLLSQYGVNSSVSSSSDVNQNTYNIALSPLFFVRGGYVFPGNSKPFFNAGRGVGYWSSRANSNTNATYVLDFDASSVYPSGSSNRYVGSHLRCLVPTS